MALRHKKELDQSVVTLPTLHGSLFSLVLYTGPAPDMPFMLPVFVYGGKK